MSRIALVLLLGLGGACAHPAPEAAPAPRASEGSVLAASPDSLWRALALASGPSPNRLPVRIPPGRVMFTVETELSPADGGSRVATRVLASPITTGSSAGAPYCVSTGRLEARIAGALDRAERAPADAG